MEETYNKGNNLPGKTSGLDWKKKTILLITASFIMGILGGFLGYSIANGNLRNPISGTPIGSKTYNVQEQSAVIDVVKKVSPSVVSITSEGSSQGLFGSILKTNSAGTGFIVDSDGLIVTNKHVVSDTNAKYTVFTSDGKKYSAEVKARDSLNDLAFVKINASNLPVAELGDSDKLEVGQTVVAIGNALGQYQNTVTTGVVSGIGRVITAGDQSGSSQESLDNVIQTDAAINPGNSGGPLLNIGGQVIGINTAMDQQGQSIGFAIPINMIKKQVSSVESSGKIVRPVLGVRYIPITKDLAASDNLKSDKGALVYGGDNPGVVPGSAADKAGIKEADIILKINNDSIDENNSITSILQKYSPGDKVTLTILRDGNQKTVVVTLGSSS